MIVEKVEKALAKAKALKSKDVPLLAMLMGQLNIAKRPSKSGDTVTDEKAIQVINQLIEGIERDKRFNLHNEKVEAECNKKISMLKKLLEEE